MNELHQEGKIKLFKIVCQVDGYSLLMMRDYVNLVNQFKGHEKECPAIYDAFLNSVIPNCREVIVENQMLGDLLGEECSKHINILFKSGFLQKRDKSSCWFGVPGSAPIYEACEKASKNIISALKRTTFKEMLEKDLLEKKLRNKKLQLGVIFHIRDMLGNNIICRKATTSGTLIHFHPSFDFK
uniref:Uncharacterized protein n=1 Tax=Arcella intermedia TaxID=1963864 RepID=A0A6B2LIT1_9EUKA